MLKLTFVLPSFFFVVAAACGSQPLFSGDDIALFDAEGTDTTLQKDVSSQDASDEDATPFNGGKSFLCNDCICDGTLDLCEHFSGGKMPIFDAGSGDAGDADMADAEPFDSGFGEAGACVPDAGQSYCAAIPIDCLPKPTCACLETHFPPGCMCGVDTSGSGFIITCINP